MAEPNYGRHACRHCGTDTHKPMYCGNRCKVAAWKRANPDAAKAARRREAAKRAPIPRKSRPPRVPKWTREQIKARADAQSLASNRQAHAEKAVSYCCQVCELWSCPLYGSKLRAFCGADCQRKAARAAKDRRKVVERAAVLERFTPEQVFERDGWTCQLCGVPTPQALRGTCMPNAPELDHCLPLALDGPHTKANTQCLCRTCNSRKSDAWCEVSVGRARGRGLALRQNNAP